MDIASDTLVDNAFDFVYSGDDGWFKLIKESTSYVFSVYTFPFLLSILIFPIAVFSQIILINHFHRGVVEHKNLVATNKDLSIFLIIWIFVKWTMLHIIAVLTIKYIPIPMPIIKTILSLFVTSLWASIVYFEIIAKSYCEDDVLYEEILKENFIYFCGITIVSTFKSYVKVILIFLLSALFPKSIITLIILYILIFGNYDLMSKFIEKLNN